MERHSQQFFTSMNAGELMLFVEKRRISLQNCKSVEFDKVTITPAYIEFVDPREGQSYEAEIKIVNRGTECAFIRIKNPMSFTYSVKPILRGLKLAPGLTIKRIVTYNYTKASISPYAEIPIYINDELFLYPLFNTMSEVEIEAVPNEIHFGYINVQRLSHTETFLVKNLCGKAVRFVVDIRSQCILTVEPTRGVLKPKESVKFTVQMMSEEPGDYSAQFWIKCKKPIIVKTDAHVLQPHFKILHPLPMTDHTFLLDFGKTYLGATVSKTLVIRNNSACKTMYCTTVEYGQLESIVQQGFDYHKSPFTCSTANGRFHPLEDKTLTVTFSPHNTEYRKGLVTVKHYFYLFKCTRVHFQDIIEVLMSDLDGLSKDPTDHRNSISAAQSQSSLLSTAPDDESVRSLEKTRSIYDEIENSVLAFMYAEAFTASVDLVPSEIYIDDIALMNTTTRVINIKNTNSHIPIYFEYRKTAYIEVNPPKGKIEPLGHFDVLVKIVAAEPGKIKTKIIFDLLYPHLPLCDQKGMEIVGRCEAYVQFQPSIMVKKPVPKINHGITPVITHETGFLPEEVAFNTSISLPAIAIGRKIKDEEKNSDIIAFPNDRPNSLRPRRNLTKKCTTIYAKIPRNVANWDVYDLPHKLKEDRALAKTYINMYVEKRRNNFIAKQKRTRIIENEKRGPDYELTDKRHVLMKNMPNEQCTKSTLFEEGVSRYSRMLPLSPKLLHNIKVHPSKIFLKHIFVNSCVTETVTIKNLNDFSLWVYLKPLKKCLTVFECSRKCIHANSVENFLLEFNAPSKAKQVFVTINVIANDCHFTEIDFAAQVSEMMVLLDHNELMFENGDDYKILTLNNLVYARSCFYWKLSGNGFRIVPMSGIIPPLGLLKCAIYRNDCDNFYHDTEAQLNFVMSPLYKTVSLNVKYTPYNMVLLGNNINISNLPLNHPQKRTVIIRNLDSRCSQFTIIGQDGIPGLTVSPTSGILKGKQDRTISIIFHIQTVCDLNCTLRIVVGCQTELNLNIKATVVYPTFHISPSVVHFKKVACGSTSKISFTIENKCPCRSQFQFPLDDIPTYSVKEFDDYTADVVPRNGVYIEPGEKKKFYLFFTPVVIRTVKFYLPLVINGILGSASMNVSDSKTFSHFLQKYNKVYSNVSKFKLSASSSLTLSTLTIVSTTTNVIFHFSKVAFQFKNSCNVHFKSHLNDVLTITNVGDTENEFCIRTDDIKENIVIFYTESDHKPEFNENSVSAVLKVNQKISLDIAYKNTSKESEKVYAPVFIRNYEKGPLFRYLSFEYIYHAPTITSADEFVFFPPVPPCCGIGRTIDLYLSHHATDECNLTIENDLDSLIIIVDDRKRINSIDETVVLNLFFYFKSPTVINTFMNIKCSCGGSLKIGIKGCADNCLVTNHSFVTVFVDPKNPTKPADEYIFGETDSNSRNLNINKFCVFSEMRVNIQDYCYPFFPTATTNSNSKYYEHMHNVCNILERIIFVQGLRERKFIEIPDGFTTPPPRQKTKEPFKKKEAVNLYFEEVLVNIFGKHVMAVWCGKRTTIDSDPERLVYTYETYSSIITYVGSNGGTFPHVCPEYLFSYDDYLTFINEIVPQDRETYQIELKNPYNEQDFYLRSKQCWIDLLLQMFKIMSLFQINSMPLSIGSIQVNSASSETDFEETKSSSVTTDTSTNVDTILEQNSFQYDDTVSELISFMTPTPSGNEENEFLSKHELLILNWIETCYNTQITQVWKTKKDGELLQERQLKSFHNDLHDCLALLATVSYYCPFFDDRIEEIAFETESMENKHHNAIILTQWLQTINIDVSISPEMVSLKPTAIYMLMLSSYLFNFLPSLYPRKTMYMEANINKSTTKSIMIHNNDKETIMYAITFVNNTLNSFITGSDKIIVPSKKTYQLKLTFQANSINSVKAFVILNGENRGYRYAKCMVYVLYGTTKFEQCTTTITLNVPIYKSINVNLFVKSPFKIDTSYKMNYTIGKPKSSDAIKLLSWMTKQTIPVLPSRIFSEKDNVECNSDGVGQLNLRVFCLSDCTRTYVLFFTNSEVGDFCVELRVLSEASEIVNSTIYIDTKKDILLKKINERCICEMTSVIRRSSSCINLRHHCPKFIKIFIPRQNSHLWAGVGNLFRTTITGLKDWSENFASETFVGSKLLFFAVDNASESCRGDIDQLYNEDVLYDVNINTRTVTMPSRLLIDGVRKIKQHIEVSIHLNITNLSQLENLNFTLVSDDLTEKRYYNAEWVVSL